MRIGIFGGTFDPPHIGHINACKIFANSFAFDKVFVIPVYLPPHKSLRSSSSVQNRLDMSMIAFSRLADNIEVSDIEIKRQGKSYTADTIRHFKELGCDEIYFLCGTDMLLTLGAWYKPEYILNNATIVYARRENDSDILERINKKIAEYTSKYNAKIISLDIVAIDVSSTEIRNSLDDEDFLSKYLTEDIIYYIKDQNLYREE